MRMQPFTFFVSYRRQDTAPIALLLKNEIEKRLQFVRVSVDVDEMNPGDNFPDRLKRLIEHSAVIRNERHKVCCLIEVRKLERLHKISNLGVPEVVDVPALVIVVAKN